MSSREHETGREGPREGTWRAGSAPASAVVKSRRLLHEAKIADPNSDH